MLKSLSIAAVSVLALGLSACSQPSGQDAAPKATNGVINLYTARHYDADEKIYAAFTKATGIEVRRLEMKPDQLIEKMKAEADASPADVILMADAGALWRAENAGLLQPVTSEVLTAKIPEAQRDPTGLWFGFSKRARVIVYDTNKVKPEEVATYESLASPRFKGKVCVRSSDNVYNLSIMAAMIEHWGPAKAEQWARGVVANMARQPEGGDTDQIRAVAAGVCEVALSNTYYYLRIADSKDAKDVDVIAKTKLAFPAFEGKGTHVNISGGA
ncbi:MAG: extracellular solute-binding protein, partial [Asticcacaulis sp.]